MKWLRRKRQPALPLVTLGGEAYQVQPLNIEELCELLVILLPYIAKVAIKFGSIATAYKANQVELLQTLLRELSGELTEIPGQLTRVVALLLHVDPDWLIQTATAQEIVNAISVLDQVNDFASLIQSIADLGIELEIIDA